MSICFPSSVLRCQIQQHLLWQHEVEQNINRYETGLGGKLLIERLGVCNRCVFQLCHATWATAAEMANLEQYLIQLSACQERSEADPWSFASPSVSFNMLRKESWFSFPAGLQERVGIQVLVLQCPVPSTSAREMCSCGWSRILHQAATSPPAGTGPRKQRCGPRGKYQESF